MNLFNTKNNEILSAVDGYFATNPTDSYIDVTNNGDNTIIEFCEREQDGSRVLNKVVVVKNPNSYLANAFSIQMLEDINSSVKFEEVDSLPYGLISAVGHQDTANVLGVSMNRVNVSLSKGDVLYIAQLVGGRLPEGSTILPDGFEFKLIKATVF